MKIVPTGLHSTRCALLALGLSAPVCGQDLLWTAHGEVVSDRFGSRLARLGDVDGDGIAEVVVGAPMAKGENDEASAGSVSVLSGRTGELLWRRSGDSLLAGLGGAVAAIADVDGDGAPDVLVGASGRRGPDDLTGAAYVYSGATGDLLHTFLGSVELEQRGKAVGNAGDLDGDGVEDFMVGAPGALSIAGAVDFYSGADFQLIRRVSGATSSSLGFSLDHVGDVDGDGIDDVILGAYRDPRGGFERGTVRLVSGKDGSDLWTRGGRRDHDKFGHVVVGLDDVDGDGIPDVGVGSPYFSAGQDFYLGRVWILSGATGDVVFEYRGKELFGFLGTDMATADVDGDGQVEMLLAQPGNQEMGSVVVRETTYGSERYRYDAFEPEHVSLGSSVVRLGDLDGDGCEEIAIGANRGRHPDDEDYGAGLVCARSGARLFLNPTPRFPQIGETITLDASKGIPGVPVLFAVATFDQQPFFRPLVQGQFNPRGVESISGPTPPLLSGLELGVQALTFRSSGRLLLSRVEPLRFE